MKYVMRCCCLPEAEHTECRIGLVRDDATGAEWYEANTLAYHSEVQRHIDERRFDAHLLALIERMRAEWETAKPKLGRWCYCKGCDKQVQPRIGPDFSIVICAECGWGLAPADRVVHYGGLRAYAMSPLD